MDGIWCRRLLRALALGVTHQVSQHAFYKDNRRLIDVDELPW